ncbi:preprotein translocase [Verrucosispora sp. ts21]|uniref:YchJ family protein n=1 Tax=Verrucosispora sp. ts21 TaxID=2069341 RepID=UPI000C88A7B0|nr:YchJ family protein [Verrucosispora sp. ts21]PMR57578.1 preprotein translocase [Verrucosispora sp. ts21]
MARRDSRQPRRAVAVGVCPCGTGLPYGDCCGRLHSGEAQAPTAEALMRSRYAAFAVGDADYLLHSWHSSTRPARLRLDPGQRWTGLEIVATEQGGLFDSTGTVEFRARYRDGVGAGSMTERSRFVREDGRWVYLDVDKP